ncbi:KDEL motif-containing protein 1 [Habropoda laboriosa]|uniref:KDEL motif-containing protein 1 n=1 Tax=Habropoda laboriosa TaxID=597456 RepID=A0A0L7R8H9_9HYME|nr:PREDICTED: KDEL motif-containing protein 1-like [Habropoda laboriosa]KOC67192.1 KDEL motif-containing protein 1 [Habropoda laboriosa]
MIFISILLLLFCQEIKNLEIDPSKTIIWGPGLKPDKATMRARYIFLQLTDLQGKNLTESPGKDIINVSIQGQTSMGNACHVWTQILDCKDGSFIVRYKLHNTCFNIKLKIKMKHHNLPILSIESKGPVYEEECYCPNPSINKWLEDLECSKNYIQIHKDLAIFASVDFNKIRQSIIKAYDRPGSVSLCHYVVKSNKIFRKCYGRHVGFKIFMDSILLSITRKVVLPDIEFFVNLGDWPLVPKGGKIYPIFSWCGSYDTKDIVMPTYDITVSSLEAMGRVMLDILSVQGNTDTLWEEKIEKVFWRGRDSCRERLDLIDISRKYPDLFNVSITNFFFFENETDKYGPGQSHISFFNFFKYKYQLNIDGSVAAYRFPYLLAGDAMVLKQESKYYEFFYNDLVPGKHYVPVKNDLSDLVEKIIWAKENDKEALQIAKSARQFARDNLLPHDVLCYHVALFHEWSKRLKSKVKVLDNMEEVLQPKHSCKCYNDDVKLKEEL